MQLLGVTIDPVSRSEVSDLIRLWLSVEEFRRIATVNPEFLVLADDDEIFCRSLEAADLRLADGFGIVVAGWFRGDRITRFSGADLMEDLLRVANAECLSVYIAARKDGLSSLEEMKESIRKRYPNILIDGEEYDPSQAEDVSGISSDILLCNFGAPEQEYFLESCRAYPGTAKIAVGVGGSLDYLTGKIARAPIWFRYIGFEWLWRLGQQPRRWRRIWNATGVFFWKVLQKGKGGP